MADAAIAGERVGWVPAWSARVGGALAARLAAERDRRLLWLPVCFGGGISLYFALTVEPPLWPGVAAAITGAALSFALRRYPVWCGAALMLAIAASGFALMRETAWERQTPMLQRQLGPVTVTGRVVDIDLAPKGWRIVVEPDPLAGLDPEDQPRRLRLHIPQTSDELRPGDKVRLKAMIHPVPPQILPGGRDFQRELYFAQIGGVGYAFGGARRVSRGEDEGAPSGRSGWQEFVQQLRTEMSWRITTVLPGATGGIASTLITGKRGAIPEADKQAFRDSGLAHLLVVAGLHLGLVGGFVFVFVRGGLALIPWVALRYPIKKIAAALALVVMACYLFISGAAVPTQRAFVMNGIVFAAIMIDRLRISMRICAIAAVVVLAVDPASLAGVSFQMSFGAVVALIAAYETYGQRLHRLLHRPSILGQIFGYCGAVVVTTLVATVGTEPFSVYHFHHVALYSPLANVLAVPISAMWTLPWGLAATLLMPLDLERLALVPMGWGINVTLWIAQGVAAMPGNVWSTPRMPVGGLLLVVFGGLWLCLWQGKWRRWGAVAVVAGLATTALTRPPDIVIADSGRFLAARAVDGRYFVSADKGEKMPRSFLAAETGEALAAWPQAGDKPESGLDCSGELCFYAARGRRVAIVTGASALPVKCGGIDAIVSQAPAGFRCRSMMPVIDRIDSWRRGAVALWLDETGITVESTNETRGDRPWVPHPRPKGQRPPSAESR